MNDIFLISSLSTTNTGGTEYHQQRQSTLALAYDEHPFPPNIQLNAYSYPYNYSIGGPSSSASEHAVGGVYTHHQFEITETGMFRCPYCPEQFQIDRILKKHISLSHADALPYSCKECGKGFFSGGGYRFHMQAHGSRKFVCSICDFAFKHKHHLKNHMFTVHKLRACPKCMIGFSPVDFNIHIRSCDVN